MHGQPLHQFFQILSIHSGHKFLLVDVVDGKNVIFVEHDLVSLIQPMQSCFDERIIYDATKVARRPFFYSDSEVFAPATGWNILLWQRHE